MKRRYRIREYSLAWFIVRFRHYIVLAILISLVAWGINTSETTVAEEPEVPELPEVVEDVEIIEPDEPTEPIIEEPVKLWAVPMDEDLQLHVVEVAGTYGIEPELILAVIGQESNYNPDAVGDNGNSKGLMQIQRRWHKERMEKLGCRNLMNPYQNITVGTDYIAELMNKYDTIEEVLMCYNAGEAGAKKLYFSKGIVSDYAKEVVARYEELKGEKEEC